MAITVARGLRTRMREGPGWIVLQVQQASDLAAAAAALRAAEADIWALPPGPNYVSRTLVAPTGPFVFIDAKAVPYKLLNTIPDIVTRRLGEAGVADAVIASPGESDLLSPFGVASRAVVLRLYPPPPPIEPFRPERPYHNISTLPDSWLHEAVAWVGGSQGDVGPLLVDLMGMRFPLAVDDAPDLLSQCRAASLNPAQANVLLASGDPGVRPRMALGAFSGFEHNFALVGGGPGADDDELLDLIDHFQVLARRLASEVGYAFVAVEPTFAEVFSPDHSTEWAYSGIGEHAQDLSLLVGEVVLDAFAWQLLGPGHVERLDGLPPGARPVGAGLVELSVGEPSDWLFRSIARSNDGMGRSRLTGVRRNPDVAEAGRRLLAPCLLRHREASAILRARREQHQQRQ